MLMEFRASIEQYGKIVHFSKGQRIYQAGEEVKNVYYIMEGLVKLADDAKDGQTVTIALLYPGNLFGFLERFNGEIEYSRYSVALTNTKLVAIPIEVLLQQSGNSIIEQSLVLTLIKQLSEAHELIFVHSKMTVEERLRWLLKKLAKDVNGVLTVDIPLTHEEISFMLGCSRQKITMYLNKWKKEGRIQYERGNIQLLHIDQPV
ncbi:Crp/Fnr family transcriptional regulator [Lysinibacillus endophyticus]|uniref:Crp/Fnr family transcriptional regulator n=2 Tax=Ureibacillus endophyticus TaxID=1978490 RepID=A0A494YU74_9BACL|nr:Crp/Fnr family transcriptional regulator [Lysinibacillus endophyticus]